MLKRAVLSDRAFGAFNPARAVAAIRNWTQTRGQNSLTYDRGRRTLTYAVERVARLSRAELVALSPLHRGWVEEEGNAAEDYYVLFLS